MIFVNMPLSKAKNLDNLLFKSLVAGDDSKVFEVFELFLKQKIVHQQ